MQRLASRSAMQFGTCTASRAHPMRPCLLMPTEYKPYRPFHSALKISSSSRVSPSWTSRCACQKKNCSPTNETMGDSWGKGEDHAYTSLHTKPSLHTAASSSCAACSSTHGSPSKNQHRKPTQLQIILGENLILLQSARENQTKP